ncbi:MAG: bifunctional DNA-formamidopyrimidine glycosylase/DNA-(apurinic or apyrimidinic site) lyase [Acidimicrobiia bacterium]
MPELPEVEITRRHLAPAMTGRRFARVEVTHPRTARHNGGDTSVVESRLRGRLVTAMARHGKFLVAPLDAGFTMVSHLGMSGRFTVGDGSEAVLPHTHFRARMDDGSVISFIDPRTFGFVAVFDEVELETTGLSRLGPDAWDGPPTAAELRIALRNRTAPIKALLLDQAPIAGLGNIYADESLFVAGIDPRTPGGEVDDAGLERLLQSVHDVLRMAIDNGGTSLDDLAYLLPDGRAGENLGQLKVYGRDGEPCYVCGEIIDRVVIRARSTHFCPECQRG